MGIRSVTGMIFPSNSEHCQCHEHIFIRQGKSREINRALYMDNYNCTVKELKKYKKAGGDYIVDAQPPGCGRMTGNLVKASRETGVNIIASTGFHKMKFYYADHWIHKIGEEAFTQFLVDELEEGMYINTDKKFPEKQTKVRAGIIKTAFEKEEGVNQKRYRELLTAAARASRLTGASIMCHTDKGKGAMEVIEILQEQGVPAKSIIICHLDRRIDNIDLHIKVAEKGVYLDYDTVGRFKYHSDEEEVELIKKMVDAGNEDNILLSLDTTRERLKSYGGEIGLDYLLKYFIPFLKKSGINEETVKKFVRQNPLKALQVN